MQLPEQLSTSTEISLITGVSLEYDASNTLVSYTKHVYQVPFLVWFVIFVTALYFINRLILEYVKRF